MVQSKRNKTNSSSSDESSPYFESDEEFIMDNHRKTQENEEDSEDEPMESLMKPTNKRTSTGKKQSNKNDVYEESSVESPVESDDSEDRPIRVDDEGDDIESSMDDFIVDDMPKRRSKNKKNAEIEDRYDDAYEVEDKKKKRTPTKKATPKRASLKKSKAIKKEDSDEEMDIGDIAPVKAKKETKKKTATVKRVKSEETATKRVKKETTSAPKQLKRLTDLQLLDRAMQSYKWWEAPPLPEGQEWIHLEHAGVIFPPSYVPHHVPLVYDGKPITLTPEQEELATFYATVDPEGLPLRDPKASVIFNRNFFNCFKQTFPEDSPVKCFEKCDFHLIREHLLKEREEKKKKTKDNSEKINLQKSFGYAIVDNTLQKVGSYVVEPPGLFRGRGLHPKTGTVKRRTLPEQMNLNVGLEEGVPACPLPGHNWGDVVHSNSGTWLVNWKSSLNDAGKYVFLAASSSFKGKSDMNKYEKARMLKKYITKIRQETKKNMKSSDQRLRQCATAVWLIDHLALRVGNEKSEDEADTVGCCSLRVEHFQFEDHNVVTLDFLGKDSMRFYQTIDLNKYELGPEVYANLKLFCSGKGKDQEIFDQLTTTYLNHYFSNIMPGLSAKVFRTYNASITLQQELPKEVEQYKQHIQSIKKENNLVEADTYLDDMITLYNNANRQVALLCNHQRSLPKNYKESMEKMKVKYEELKHQTEELRHHYELVKKGKKIPLKTVTAESSAEEKNQQKHLFSKEPTLTQVATRLTQYETRLKKQEATMLNKEENKLVALNTSKLNYMDPRISVAWCKKNEIPIERVFTRTLRDKFNWAMSVDENWTF